MLKDVLDQVGTHFHYSKVKTTSAVFKLLTRITVNLLVCCAILVSLRQVFGDAIECVVSDSAKKYKETIELKCWLEGFYIDRNLLNGTIGVDIVSPGVGAVRRSGYKADKIDQTYYQWVVPVLLLQALLLYVPRILWHICEGGLMSKLVSNVDSLVVNDEWMERKSDILRYVRESCFSQHRRYYFRYLGCELLGFAFLILDMMILHWVFNSFWSEYSGAVAALLHGDFVSFSRNAAMLFPLQAKCFFNIFGPSGSIQEFDVICILPQNTVNEKIFAFLYLWMIFLVIASIWNLVLVFCKVTFKPLRVREVHQMSGESYSHASEKFCLKYSSFGYWCLLSLLHRNLSPTLFKDLVNDLMDTGKPCNLNQKAHQGSLNDPGCLSTSRDVKLAEPSLGSSV